MTTITIPGGSYTVPAGTTLNFVDEAAFFLADGLATGAPDPSLFVDGTVNVTFTSASALHSSGLSVGTSVPYANPVVIDPSGVFTVTSSVPDQQVYGYFASGSSPPFTNKGVFTVTGAGDAIGLATWDLKPFPFDNERTFQVTSSGGAAVGVLLANGGVFHNSGDIVVSGSSGAIAVMTSAYTESFDNSGLISATSTAAGQAVAVNWAFGLFNGGWTNSGVIEGDIALKAGVYFGALGPIAYTNSGHMIGAVQLTDLKDNFTNTGTVTGDISFGDGGDSFSNSGTIQGHIDLGPGADLLSVKSGSVISDVVDGGAGSDGMTFDTPRSAFAVHTALVGASFVTTAQDTTGADGTTMAKNVETFAFGGYNFGFAGIQQNHQQNFDAGRFDDVLFQRTSTGTVYYQDMNGSASPGGFQTVLDSLPSGWKAVGSGDINGDGRADPIIQDISTGSLYYIDYSRGGPFWVGITTGLTSDWQYVGAGDVNRDGQVDLVVRNSKTGEVLYRDIAHSTWGTVLNAGLGWKAVGVGDFNRDGASDVAIQNLSDGTVYYANMAGGVFSGWGVITGALGATWKAVGIGDINGDGYADVVFDNSATGQVWFVDMLGGKNHGWGAVSEGLSGWTVRDVADVNNDGYADVVIQSNADGTTYYASMQGGAFHGWNPVAGALGTDWVVV